MQIGRLGGLGRRTGFGGFVPAVALKTAITIGTDAQGTAPSNTTVKYTPPCGGGSINAMWQSVSSRPDTPVCCDGTISNLMVRLPIALTGTQTWDFTLVKNGVDTGLTVHFDLNSPAHPQGGQVLYDTTHSVSVVDGDTICWKSSPANTPPAITNLQIGALFLSATGQVGPMFTGWTGSAAGTGYGTPGNLNSSAQAESSRRAYMPTAGTISKLRINTNTAPGGTETRSVTLMKNGVDMLTATITGSATSAVATGSVSYAPGDLIQLRKVASAAAASGLTNVGTDWSPSNAGETLLLAPGTGNADGITTLFQNLQGTAENSETVEGNVYNPIPVAASITKFRFDLAVAPGVGKSRVATVRKNVADTAAAITVQDNATSGSWSGTIALAAGDLFDWKQVPTGTPAASNPFGASAVLVVS